LLRRCSSSSTAKKKKQTTVESGQRIIKKKGVESERPPRESEHGEKKKILGESASWVIPIGGGDSRWKKAGTGDPVYYVDIRKFA